MLDLVPLRKYKSDEVLLDKFHSDSLFRVYGTNDKLSKSDILTKYKYKRGTLIALYSDTRAVNLIKVISVSEL